MRFLDLTLPTPAENLALDEALLEQAEAGAVEANGGDFEEVLRIWEPRQTMVVVGRSSRRGDEVNLAECQRRGVPVLRRASGGAAIVTGPGCLMYALVLGYARRAALRAIDQAHCFVLSRLADALRPLCPEIEIAGTSDLALAGRSLGTHGHAKRSAAPAAYRKVSGNSMRCRREHFLYHGTLLYDFPLQQISDLLRPPPRQPDYRAKREHADFVANLPASESEIREAIVHVWRADVLCESWPRARMERLVVEKYQTTNWNERL